MPLLLNRRGFLALGSATAAGLLSGCGWPTPTSDHDRLSAAFGFRPMLLSGDDTSAAIAKDTGFDGLVSPVASHLLPQADDSAFAPRLEAIRRLPIPALGCNVFLPASLRVTGPSADHDAIVRYATQVFSRARRAGVARITFGSGKARQVPAAFPLEQARDQFISLLRRLAPLAADHGILLLPETLNRRECNFINKLSDLVSMVSAVNERSVRATADLYHMRIEEDTPADLAAAIPWLGHVEIAEKEKRTVPGIAGDDFRPYFAVLKKHGWNGSLNVEGARATADQYRTMFRTLETQWREATV